MATRTAHHGSSPQRPAPAPAVCLLRRPVHGPLDKVATSRALPVVCAVEVDFVNHGVVGGDVIAACWTLHSMIIPGVTV